MAKRPTGVGRPRDYGGSGRGKFYTYYVYSNRAPSERKRATGARRGRFGARSRHGANRQARGEALVPAGGRIGKRAKEKYA